MFRNYGGSIRLLIQPFDIRCLLKLLKRSLLAGGILSWTFHCSLRVVLMGLSRKSSSFIGCLYLCYVPYCFDFSTPEKQLERLCHRTMTTEQAKARIASQLPSDYKIQRATYCVDNNGGLACCHQPYFSFRFYRRYASSVASSCG